MNRRRARATTPAIFPPLRAACVAAAALALAAVGTVRAETLTLADCLRETAAHNPEIIGQQYAVQRATAERLTFRARALPTMMVGGILGYLGEKNAETLRTSKDDPNTGKTTQSTATFQRSSTELVIGTGEFSQSIFDAAIPASWRRGDLGITAAQENFYTVASAQLHATRVLFYQTLFQQESGAVLQRLDDFAASEIRSLNQLAAAGLIGRQALLAAQVQRTNFGSTILANGGGLRVSLTSLLQNMGRELGPARVAGSSSTADVHLAGLLEDRALSFDAAAAAREALAHRPDLLNLRATVRLMNEDANIARAGYYPLVRVYVAGELIPQSFVQRNNTNAVRDSDETQTTEVRPGVRESWAIIDTGQVRGAVRGLQAQRDAISIALQQAERNLPADLALVRARVTGAAAKIAALRDNTDTAENTLNMIQAGLAQGLDSQIEFLDAQTGVLNTRAGLLRAQLEMSLAHAEFDRLTGRYLKFIPTDPAATHPAPARK